MAAFEELGLMEQLGVALEEMEWYLPKPVQQDCIPHILGGVDVMCAAETGAGKTGAFCLPIIQLIYEKMNKGVDTTKIKAQLKHCTLNKEDVQDIRVAENGLTCNVRNLKTWGGARAMYGAQKGKWAYNVKVTTGTAVRFGWALADAALELGKDKGGYGYANTGKKHCNNYEAPYGEAFTADDVITCLCDRDARVISFLKNGKSQGEAFTIPEKQDNLALFPCVSAQSGAFELDFGLRNTTTTLPEGYQWIEEANGEMQEKLYAAFARKRAKEKKGERHSTSCIILEPTLELCQQIVDELNKFVKYIDSPKITTCSIFGRRSTQEICDELRSGVDIVVGTTARVKQFLDMPEHFFLEECEFIVLDEADRLMEDTELIKRLYTDVRKVSRKKLQLCMFSATLHDPAITTLASQLCPNASWVDLKGKDFVPDTVHHAVVFSDPDDDDRWKHGQIETDGVHIAGQDQDSAGPDPANRMSCRNSYRIKLLKPEILMKVIDAYKMEQCLIFCRTRDDCDHLSAYLNTKGGQKGFTGRAEKGKENPYSNVAFHSGFDTRTRKDHLDMFKEGEVRFLICTDVAARGIDIKQLPFVVNMCLPDKSEDYIHRIGRTGRSDRMGLAVTIASSKHREKVWYHSNCNRGMRHGAPCTDTRLVEEGGCCIWYNEPQYLKEVEKRIGEPLAELGDDYKYVDTSANAAALEYGKSREEAKMKKSDQIRAIEEHATMIMELSSDAQNDYLTYASLIKKLEANPPKSQPVFLPAKGRGRGSTIPEGFPRTSSATTSTAAPGPQGVKTFATQKAKGRTGTR
eukprot:TRINITY_DN3163_c0_g2_i1.p1 TRINITY_DN3163_c0_g2~~TRINITY_DN3163_c0_g2_i1.p1  ORF type:complete len:814 (+),score=320.67 TRINITY_DN3163_c0_g2_i1:36-2444(+)